MRNVLIGAAAGAVGTTALNITTYSDMAIRGRASSDIPAQVVETLAGKVGVDLSPEREGRDKATQQNRLSGLGALSGYVVGLGVGAAYGLARSSGLAVPPPVAAVGLGVAAMAGSDVPITMLGISDPRTWGVSGWASDIVPHLVYGLFTALAYDAFAGSPGGET